MCYPALSTHHLTKAFAGKTAVQSCSLSVEQGCIYGFLVRFGAGKTSAPFFLFAAGRIAGGSCRLDRDAQKFSACHPCCCGGAGLPGLPDRQHRPLCAAAFAFDFGGGRSCGCFRRS